MAIARESDRFRDVEQVEDPNTKEPAADVGLWTMEADIKAYAGRIEQQADMRVLELELASLLRKLWTDVSEEATVGDLRRKVSIVSGRIVALLMVDRLGRAA